MTARARIAILAAIVAASVIAFAAVAVVQGIQARDRAATASDVAVAEPGAFDDGPRIVFRSTAAGDLFGRVAIVALDDPDGPREVTDLACERIDAVPGVASCLRIERGIATTFSATLLDGSWNEVSSWPLPGIPSRTRLSDDGTRVSTTAFVTGHSYATTGFSTETVIHGTDASGATEDFGNIESYTLTVDGAEIAPVDRNMWGVTFADETTFYATTQSQTLGKTWLVLGDVEARTLVAVAEGVECPSLSPDGTRIAYKADVDPSAGVHWTPSILDLTSGDVTLLESETTSIDDQIEWLDEHTILYGVPREDETGVTDVWSLDAAGGGAPRVLIPEAWSPAVIQSGGPQG